MQSIYHLPFTPSAVRLAICASVSLNSPTRILARSFKKGWMFASSDDRFVKLYLYYISVDV